VKKQFGSDKSNLEVMLNAGKRGFNVHVRVVTPGERTATGMRSTHPDEKTATAKFDALCTDALKRGWTAKVPRASFTEMPAPPKGKK
jgi:hypothetical protein